MMFWERDVLVKQEQMKDLLRQREEERRFMGREKRRSVHAMFLQRLLASSLPRLRRLVLRRAGSQRAPGAARKEVAS